jgi:hypothetical protein
MFPYDGESDEPLLDHDPENGRDLLIENDIAHGELGD